MKSDVIFHMAIAGMSLSILNGCQHVPETSPATTGQSFFKFITPGVARKKQSAGGEGLLERKPRVIFVEAKPIEPLSHPVYPPQVLGARLPLVLVGVRITVDAVGNVTAVAPSLVTFSTPNPFSEEFQAAIEVAVRRWKFLPAEVHHMTPMSETPAHTIQELDAPPQPLKDYWRVTEIKRVESSVELLFTFASDGNVLGFPAARETGKDNGK